MEKDRKEAGAGASESVEVGTAAGLEGRWRWTAGPTCLTTPEGEEEGRRQSQGWQL